MKKFSAFTFLLCSLYSFLAQAQMAASTAPAAISSPANADIERARIGRERTQLEADFSVEDAACYRKFLVNNCRDEVKVRRGDFMADLRRQELSINEQERKARAADQVFKTEQKASPEKQREAADRRAASLKDFNERLAREKLKNADRATMQSNEKVKSESAADRAKGNAAKVGPRSEKQAAAADEARKFSERLEKAKERQTRHERDQASQTNPPAKPLPRPE